MTDYYPYTSRKSLLEKCLLNAFKETWEEQEKEASEAIKLGEASTNENPYPYSSFSLKKVNQNFEIGGSELFVDATLLHLNMYNINQDLFRKSEIHRPKDGKEIYPQSTFISDSFFETTQIDEKISYNDAIKIIHNLYMLSPDMVYGVLLSSGSKFINPLHPLIAQSFVRNNGDEDSTAKKYKMIIYSYSNTIDNSRMKFYFNENYTKLFTDHILNLLAMLDIRSNFGSKITSYSKINQMLPANEISTWSKFTYQYEITNTSDKEFDDISMQPVQLINNGIAIPYYGVVAEKNNRNTGITGYQLSPMLSCNVGYPYVNIFDNNDVSVRSLSVCTGNFSSSSTEGKQSLNHANLNSPYFSETITEGSFTFAKICVKMSLGIYAEHFGLEPINFMPEEVLVPISFDEYKKLNPNSKLKDYLESIK